MDKLIIITRLREQYPDKDIIALPTDDPSEILCEVEPSSDHPEYSVAIAVIDKSGIHYHAKSTETYKILEGELDLFVDGIPHHLKGGESMAIKPHSKHYAVGCATWVECRSEPGWTAEDHFLVQDVIPKDASMELMNIIKKLSSGGVLVSKDGKIALVHQSGGSWGFPKGAPEEGEEPLDAAVREVQEETGVQDINLIRFLETYERTVATKYPGGPDVIAISMYLFATKEDSLIPNDAGTISAQWFDKKDVVSQLTHPKDKEFFISVIDKI